MKKEKETTNKIMKMMPVMNAPKGCLLKSISFDKLNEDWAIKIHNQTLNRLSNRGGLSYYEIYCNVKKLHPLHQDALAIKDKEIVQFLNFLAEENNNKLYAERDIEKLDQDGNYYFKHVGAMTAENLYFKSAIAAELAHRDFIIDQLKKEKETANKICQYNIIGRFIGGKVYETSCGQEYQSEDEWDPLICFCQYCGGKIELVDI